MLQRLRQPSCCTARELRAAATALSLATRRAAATAFARAAASASLASCVVAPSNTFLSLSEEPTMSCVDDEERLGTWPSW